MKSWWGTKVAAGIVPFVLLVTHIQGCGEDPPPAVVGADSGPENPTDAQQTAEIQAPPADSATDDASPSKAAFCAAHAAAPFCDDFHQGREDAEAGPRGDWDVITEQNGLLSLDASELKVETTPLISSLEEAHAHLRVTRVGSPTNRVVLSFRFRLASPALFDSGALAIATLDLSLTHGFTLYLRDEDPTTPGPALEELNGATRTRHALTSAPLAPNDATTITIELDVATSKATVRFDATSVLVDAPIANAPSEDPTIRLGAVYVFGPAPAIEARFDDVLLEF